MKFLHLVLATLALVLLSCVKDSSQFSLSALVTGLQTDFFDNKELSFRIKLERHFKNLTNVAGRDVQHKSIEPSDPHLDSKSFHRKNSYRE